MQQPLDGRYEILKPLSSGGFGKTYLARDLRIPGTPICVVKQLHCVSRTPQDIQLAQQLFQREAESLAKLGHHDQIPRLLAYFTENDEFFLVEDYIEGRSIEDEIKPRQPWPESAVIDLVRGILDVLAYVHSQGVIHRDIKPANLIRRQSDGKIVLIDFGAIKQIEQVQPGQANHTGTQIGTAGFMPPEQAQGKPRPNSDIYGTGMVGISALTGQPAMGLPDDPQTGEIIWQHLAPVSPRLAQILERMVRYHFQHRYQTVAEVQQDLQALFANYPNPIASRPGTEAIPTQVVSPAASQSPPTPHHPAKNRAKNRAKSRHPQSQGPSWLLGLGLAILIPVLGGAVSLLFNQGTTFLDQQTRKEAAEAANKKPCNAIVNGNIRTDRTAYLGNQNIVQTGQGKSFEIGTKETRGGWIEILLASGQTAWTHLDVVSNESALRTCLKQKNITLQTIADIAPPSRPKTQPTPAPKVDPKPQPPETPTDTSETPSDSDSPSEIIETPENQETPTNDATLEIEGTEPIPPETTASPENSPPGNVSAPSSPSNSNPSDQNPSSNAPASGPPS
jgi:serine/threonine protein kinase, bacterial